MVCNCRKRNGEGAGADLVGLLWMACRGELLDVDIAVGWVDDDDAAAVCSCHGGEGLEGREGAVGVKFSLKTNRN